jgi:hypothetical protein
MNRLASLSVSILLILGQIARAQSSAPPNADANSNANQSSAWRRIFNPVLGFSRSNHDGSQPTASGVLQTSDTFVPPPPAPSMSPSSVPPLSVPALSAPAPLAVPTPAGPGPQPGPPTDFGQPGELSVPPAAGALGPPTEDATVQKAGPENAPPPNSVDPSSRRLRDTVPPVPGAPPQPPPSGASAGPASAGPMLVFRTADIVRPDHLRGPNYRLGEYAPLVDYNFQFEIDTQWGRIPAHGMAMLALRLRELKSIEYAARIARKNPMFAEGLSKAACDTPAGAYILVTDPIDSLYRTAVGLKRIALAKWSPNGERANCEARRRLACLLCCDPESHNPVLSCMLDDMSANLTAGWLTADVALNFGLPGLGIPAANAEFAKMMAIKSTREIVADLNAELIALGVPESICSGFLASDCYTITQRMAFVYYLHKLIGIENLSSLVEGAADVINESEALSAIQEVQLLAELRRTHPMVRVAFAGLPTVTLTDGSQMIVTSLDYIVETPRIAQMIVRHRTEFASNPTTLVTLGRVSTGLDQQLLTAGIVVMHHRLGDEEFNAKAEKAAQLAQKTSTPEAVRSKSP